MNANEPYVESGKSSGAMLLPIVGLASAAVAAFLYTTVAMNLPLAGYLTAVVIVGFAFATAYPLAEAGKLLKVRSVSTMRLYGATTGVAAVYLAWVFFAWHVASEALPPPAPSPWEWLHSPAALWEFAHALAETGWYTVGGAMPRGPVIWVLWGIEAALVIGVCVYWAPRRIEGRPFCEACGRWMQPDHSLPLASTCMVAKHVRREGLASIGDVALPSLGADHWAWLRSWRCGSCAAGVLRVDRVMTMVTSDMLSPVLRVDPLMAMVAHDLLPSRRRRATTHCEAILPLSWQRSDDAAHLLRIAEVLRTAGFA